MRLWLTLAMTGSGTQADPFRPDLKGVKVDGWVMAVSNGSECLVLASGKQGQSDALKSKSKKYHGDETQDAKGSRLIAGNLEIVVKAEANRLGVQGKWEPRGYEVG